MLKKPGADKRKKVLVFVSYASDDRPKASALLKLFEQKTGASLRHRYELWRDREIPVGVRWHSEIQKALKECNLGLLLISPAFLGSDYITRKELPRFLGRKAKPVVPVLLQPIDAQFMDLKGLTSRQIFGLLNKANKLKAFTECKGQARDDFALELFRRVEARLRQVLKRKRRTAASAATG